MKNIHDNIQTRHFITLRNTDLLKVSISTRNIQQLSGDFILRKKDNVQYIMVLSDLDITLIFIYFHSNLAVQKPVLPE